MLQVLSLRRIAPLLMGVLCAAAFLVGSASAQTTSSSTQDPQASCTSQGYSWCLPQSGGGTGWCTYSTTMKCPAYTQSDCTAQGNVWCKNSDGATGWCSMSTDTSYKCPVYTEADCKAQGQTWCVSPTGGSPWCTSSCPYSTTTTTTQSEQEKCTSGGNKWCKNSDGASGWCSYGSSATCPAYTEADCSAQSGKWCKYAPSTSVGSYSTSSVTGWCQADKNYVCPANTESECKAQNKIWCSSPYGGSPWCTDSCPYANTTTSTTPISEESKCSTGGGKWCKSTTSSGWCSYGASPCPATNDTECKAQGGEWCFYSTYTPTTSGSTMGSGWCSSTPGNCPVNDKATCTAKGRTWCVSSYTSGGVTSSGWCATTGSTCPTDTPMMNSGGWPNTKAPCEDMYGKWCENSSSGSTGMYTMSSGWCQSANRTCPAPYKPGYMTCWDNTQVPSASSCPATPTTEADCSKAGKSWCKYYSGTGGWCSNETCETYSPSGQMTCPDGKTFVSSFDKCPRRSTTVQPIEVINEFKTCSGGKVVKITENCPPIENYVMCANGSQAPTLASCPPIEVKKDEITNCMNNGGNWCADNSGKGTGYCQPKGVACGTSVVYPPGPDQPPVEVQNRPLTAREIRDIERMRKQYVRELNELGRIAKRDKSDELIKKIADLQKELAGMKLTDSSAWEKLRDFQDTMQDLRDALQDSFGSPGEMDEKMQRRALQQMKSGAKQFLRSLEAKKKQVDKLTKQGVNVDTEIVDLLRQAIEMAKLVDKATTYDEVRDIMEQIPDMAEKMNEVFPKLEMLSRLPKAIAVVNRQLTVTDKMVKGALQQAKRRGIDDTEQVQRMVQRVADARAALAQVKDGSVSVDDIFDFIDASILEPLEEARDIANGITSIANARAAVGKLQASVKQYTARIKKLKVADEDVSQAEEVLGQLNEEIAALRAATARKITQDVAEEVLGSLDRIGDLIDEIEVALGLVKPDAILQQIRNSLEKGGEEFDEIRVDDLEKLIVRSFRTARFADSMVGRNVALY